MSPSERIQWQPPNSNFVLENFEKRCHHAKAQPFLDEKPMNDTAAACAWENFRRPLLGRFTRHGRIDFIKLLGYGQDGIVWEVAIDSLTYALKVYVADRQVLGQPTARRYTILGVPTGMPKRVAPHEDAIRDRQFLRPCLVKPKPDNIP
ncbi:hypothetical protein FOPG_15467 [Fusarium oxysporum f. sp. conglutinans race 2 54008]|uniref:Uncharacterized protein n=1 Tax=Fusarium oxysporum f. sp. conglutinans race 2 54008 TaxID=1089457 RepID=X0GYH9_FUSOX|nr:hypothetical protein FOPG_15467 [Fusarium oxysporum f. sp. conglutinans race 2 54008]